MSEDNKKTRKKTKVNEALVALVTVNPGTVLCDGYTVLEKLPVESGEADLFVCEKAGEKYIAKLYGRQFATKEEVVQKLAEI